jgi:hypothetical protein
VEFKILGPIAKALTVMAWPTSPREVVTATIPLAKLPAARL